MTDVSTFGAAAVIGPSSKIPRVRAPKWRTRSRFIMAVLPATPIHLVERPNCAKQYPCPRENISPNHGALIDRYRRCKQEKRTSCRVFSATLIPNVRKWLLVGATPRSSGRPICPRLIGQRFGYLFLRVKIFDGRVECSTPSFMSATLPYGGGVRCPPGGEAGAFSVPVRAGNSDSDTTADSAESRAWRTKFRGRRPPQCGVGRA